MREVVFIRRIIRYINYSIILLMIPNTNNLICGKNLCRLEPVSNLVHLQLVPFSFERVNQFSFLYCDLKDELTNICQLAFDKDGKTMKKSVQEFMGVYQYSCFGEDSVFMANREGDIMLYNLNNKDTFFAEKQHPSLFNPIQLHNIGQYFITCGGNVTSGTQENQKIVKTWHSNEEEIVSKSRIVTNHTKAIENSFILAQNIIVTLSTDKTVRSINLTTQQVDRIIPVLADYYSACPLDWNTVLLGGTQKSVQIYDIRSKRLILSHQFKIPVIQICEMVRTSQNTILMANVNQIYSCDIRKMQAVKLGVYEGERISCMSAVSGDSLAIGNRDKTMQIWRWL